MIPPVREDPPNEVEPAFSSWIPAISLAPRATNHALINQHASMKSFLLSIIINNKAKAMRS
jgi:hypothetical protein